MNRNETARYGIYLKWSDKNIYYPKLILFLFSLSRGMIFGLERIKMTNRKLVIPKMGNEI